MTQPIVLEQSAATGDLGDALRRASSGTPTATSESTAEQTATEAAREPDRQADADSGSRPSATTTLRAIEAAERATAQNDPLLARELLNRVLTQSGLPEQDAGVVRDQLGSLNRDLLFSPRIVDGDPLTSSYTIRSGDSLSRIVDRENLSVHWKLLQRVNRISDPRRVRLGQSIKLVHGPFHAVVHKRDHRLDLFTGPADAPSEWVFVASMKCGLGENNSTPPGMFVVRSNSKLENPHWVNPRTGERFDADDPENPIGERWIGIRGLGDSAPLTGYGIHGTIEPDSIGRDASMGCVRLRDDDVELVYELLVEDISRVTILP